mmetsp:Transcript_51600/g.134756  ORF Transcript_51600/g.134756 Transcript_51600/m.134756 type:complete len:130 (-) Transcript_51600:341-730(-)
MLLHSTFQQTAKEVLAAPPKCVANAPHDKHIGSSLGWRSVGVGGTNSSSGLAPSGATGASPPHFTRTAVKEFCGSTGLVDCSTCATPVPPQRLQVSMEASELTAFALGVDEILEYLTRLAACSTTRSLD